MKTKKEVKTKKNKKNFLGMTEEDFSKEKFIEGGIIRPLILMTAFFSYIAALLLLIYGVKLNDYNYIKWGGSFVIFSFVFNMYSIYESLKDKPSIFKKLNLVFKLLLLVLEVAIIGWIISLVKIAFV